MQLSENQKSDYLAEMGIAPWYPRVRLDNALSPLQISRVQGEVSAELVISNNGSEESNRDSSNQNISNAVHAKKDTQPDDGALGVVDVKLTANETEVLGNKASIAGNQDKPISSSIKPIKFGLAFYLVGDLIVANSLVSNYADYQDSSWRLLQNILKTIGQDNCELIHHHMVSWPFFANAQAAHGLEAASSHVSSVIEQLIADYKCSKFISFGGVLPKLNSWDQSQKQAFGLPLVMLPSLYKMLNDGSLKAKCWNIIKSSDLNS